MFFHFGFDSRFLTENSACGVIGWFRNSRFRFLNSKPTFLSVIMGIIIAYFRRFSFAKIFCGIWGKSYSGCGRDAERGRR